MISLVKVLNFNKLQQLAVELKSADVAFACITETWFKAAHNLAFACIDDYQCIRKDWKRRRGGGVCMYYNIKLPVKLLQL